uniref:SPOR domain-containing protein n=1 Tax=Flavobacterium sp. TaxID=239 RepID=UPI004049E845
MSYNFSKILFLVFTFIGSVSALYAQPLEINIEQDERIENLFKEKLKTGSVISNTERYKIQIFSGDNVNSRKVLTEFKSKYNEIEATIIFQTPNYKVLVGSFLNRIEATRYIDVLREEYPNAFIIKPSK